MFVSGIDQRNSGADGLGVGISSATRPPRHLAPPPLFFPFLQNPPKSVIVDVDLKTLFPRQPHTCGYRAAQLPDPGARLGR